LETPSGFFTAPRQHSALYLFLGYRRSRPPIYCRLAMIVLIFSFFSKAKAKCLASAKE
jgi:hypothetical protein